VHPGALAEEVSERVALIRPQGDVIKWASVHAEQNTQRRNLSDMRNGFPPGPAAPSLVQVARWIARPTEFMNKSRRDYGDVFTVRFASVGRIIFVSDPALIKQIFTASPDTLRAGEANWPLIPVLGTRGSLLLDGKPHLERRRVILPPFHGERLERYRELFGEVAAQHIRRWPADEPFALLPKVQAITLELIMKVVFGEDEDPARIERLATEMMGLITASQSRLAQLPWMGYDLGPYSPMGMFMRVRKRVDDLLYEEIQRRRERGGLDERHDVFSMLLQTDMSEEDLRDELMTILLAGHETTTTALAWAFERLLRHPGMYDRLRTDDRWSEAVVSETLRLRPPIPIVGRAVKQDFQLDGYTIPAGEMLAPCIWLTHRREEVYPDPYTFKPERFLDQGPETYTWLPFGGGTRRCAGAAFAQLEMNVVMKTIAQLVDMEPATPRPERVGRRAIVLAPKDGSRVVVRPRA
jgi:cytochrome P450